MDTAEKPSPITRYHTQWAAQFLVAGELSRRGYTVTLTLGHARQTDLLVESPTGAAFGVEVKGLRQRNDWFVQRPRGRGLRIYVLALVPPPPTAPDYFVLTAKEISGLIDEYERARGGKPLHPASTGFRWRDPHPHRDRWDNLPP